jgi:hypothetical protein
MFEILRTNEKIVYFLSILTKNGDVRQRPVSASKLSAFTLITPLFGVVASYFIMHDTLTRQRHRSRVRLIHC